MLLYCINALLLNAHLKLPPKKPETFGHKICSTICSQGQLLSVCTIMMVQCYSPMEEWKWARV